MVGPQGAQGCVQIMDGSEESLSQGPRIQAVLGFGNVALPLLPNRRLQFYSTAGFSEIGAV